MQETPRNENLQELLERQLANLLTEPLTVSALADWFDVSREKMATVIKRIPGVERFGQKYRVPLFKMPPKYLLETGIIHPLSLSDSAGLCRK